MTDTATNSATALATMPLFYRQIEPFETQRHGALRFLPSPTNYRFAAGATVIPLLIGELAPAMRHYPLVFLPADSNGSVGGAVLAAVVGLAGGHNLFVDADGQWRADTYVPAYVRRYPFHALRVESKPDPILAIDTSYPGADHGEPLVSDDGKPSPFMESMLALTRDYLASAEVTEGMVQALYQAGLMEDGDITLQVPTGESYRLNGFLQISEARLRALEPDALVVLQKADVLGLAYAQLLSMVNFAHLPLADSVATGSKPARSKSRKAH